LVFSIGTGIFFLLKTLLITRYAHIDNLWDNIKMTLIEKMVIMIRTGLN
jgi:hypothetical protein